MWRAMRVHSPSVRVGDDRARGVQAADHLRALLDGGDCMREPVWLGRHGSLEAYLDEVVEGCDRQVGLAEARRSGRSATRHANPHQRTKSNR